MLEIEQGSTRRNDAFSSTNSCSQLPQLRIPLRRPSLIIKASGVPLQIIIVGFRNLLKSSLISAQVFVVSSSVKLVLLTGMPITFENPCFSRNSPILSGTQPQVSEQAGKTIAVAIWLSFSRLDEFSALFTMASFLSMVLLKKTQI
jgi:hypothetical protein